MRAANEINEELRFNMELAGLLDAIKSVAVLRFRALQEKKGRFTRFTPILKNFFGMMDLRSVKHPFISPRTGKIAIVMITSDEGFVGGLNLRVTDAAFMSPASSGAEFIVVGEKGVMHLKEAKKEFTAFRNASNVEDRYKLALELKDHILKGVRQGQFGKVLVFYPRSVSFIVHRVEVAQLLPVALPKQAVNGVIPAKAGIYTAQPWIPAFAGTTRTDDVIIESPLGGIIDYLAEEEVLQKMIDILEDSKLSEFAARALHLEESNRRLKEKEKELKFQYFHAYHEKIDKNIRELFSAQVIRRKKIRGE